MIGLFVFTRILDLVSTAICFYAFRLSEINPTSLFFLEKGLAFFISQQILMALIFVFLSNKFRLVRLGVVAFTFLSIPIVAMNWILVFLNII
ncbi:MAG: hypothetical protein KatS3mg101_0937 [Patescibacteria group bacterium]|nr:MAG: hypothetical protein KatS3mg101_0937 [Patescibacteria group bacterium]